MRAPSKSEVDYIACMTYSNNVVWMGCSNGNIFGISVDTRKLLIEIKDAHKGSVTAIASSEKNNTIWSGSSDEHLCCWDISDFEEIKKPFNVNIQKSQWIRCMLYYSGRIWVGYDDSKIRIFDENTSKLMFEINAHRGNVTCLALQEDGYVWSGSADKTICKWDGKEYVNTLKVETSTRIMSLTCSPSLVWAGGVDRGVTIFSSHSGKPIKNFGKESKGTVSYLYLIGEQMWVGRGNGKIFVYNTCAVLNISHPPKTPRKPSPNSTIGNLSPIEKRMNYTEDNNSKDNNKNFSFKVKKDTIMHEKLMAEEEKKELEEIVLTLDEENRYKDVSLQNLNYEKQQLEEHNESLRQLLDEANEHINIYKEQEHLIVNDNEQFKSQFEFLSGELEKLRRENKRLNDELQKCYIQLERIGVLEFQNENLRKDLENRDRQYNSLINECSDLRNRNDSLEKELSLLRQRLRQFEDLAVDAKKLEQSFLQSQKDLQLATQLIDQLKFDNENHEKNALHYKKLGEENENYSQQINVLNEKMIILESQNENLNKQIKEETKKVSKLETKNSDLSEELRATKEILEILYKELESSHTVTATMHPKIKTTPSPWVSKQTLKSGIFTFPPELESSLLPLNKAFIENMPKEIIEAIENSRLPNKKNSTVPSPFPNHKCTIHIIEIKARSMAPKSSPNVNPYLTISAGESQMPFWTSPIQNSQNPTWKFHSNETVFLRMGLWSTYRITFWSSRWLLQHPTFLGSIDFCPGIVQILQHCVSRDKVELSFSNLIPLDLTTNKTFTDLGGTVTIKMSVLKSED